MDDHPRVRKKRREQKILFPRNGWNNIGIVSDVPGERKENVRKIMNENGGFENVTQGADP